MPKPEGPKTEGPPRKLAALARMMLLQIKEERKPAGTPPDLVEARLEDGSLLIQRTVTRYIPIQVEFAQPGPDGKVTKGRRTEYKAVLQTIAMKLDPKKALLSTVGGKDVAPEDLKRLLAKPAIIVLANDFHPVDKFYLQLYDSNVLVVVPPAPEPTPIPPPRPE